MSQTAPIAEPIPLAAPDGTVYAFACPRCRQVRMLGHVLYRADEETVHRLADDSRSQADSCCRCRRCGRELDAPVFAECPVCAPVEKAEQEERDREWADRDARRAPMNGERLAASKDRAAAARLVEVMRDISEDCWCAGWLSDLELSLWQMVVGEADGDGFGFGGVSDDQIAELRGLHEACGGWWRWDEDLGGEVFVSTDEWLRMYTAQKTEQA